MKQALMSKALIMAKNEDFREFVFNECLKQEHGEYNVYFTKVISHYKAKAKYHQEIGELENLVKQIKSLNGGIEPLIFYPRVETIEDENISTNKNGNYFLQEPVGVFQDDYEPLTPIIDPTRPPYSSPGYIVDNGSTLTYYQHITEDYAWENDVWVIGQEEIVSPGNMVAAPETIDMGRTNGEAERGGIIKVLNLNALEHWTSGKLEFRYRVNMASGTLIKNHPFGKTKRKHFRDQKWHDFNNFIANWNISNIGNWMIEGWIEEDGGASTQTITNTFPAPCTGCPTTTISFTKQNKDFDMGVTIIQFTDSKSQEYDMAYSKIKRK
ncbi:MAG: hypothetical protein HC913_09610 [Microscillaceae bacterium]|nr:hypothetical protein [Microscillaceae bacterium]